MIARPEILLTKRTGQEALRNGGAVPTWPSASPVTASRTEDTAAADHFFSGPQRLEWPAS